MDAQLEKKELNRKIENSQIDLIDINSIRKITCMSEIFQKKVEA